MPRLSCGEGVEKLELREGEVVNDARLRIRQFSGWSKQWGTAGTSRLVGGGMLLMVTV